MSDIKIFCDDLERRLNMLRELERLGYKSEIDEKNLISGINRLLNVK